MNTAASLLDELRTQYEAVHEPTEDRHDVESFEAIDGRMRKAFRWLEQAITYLNGVKPPIDHRFDLGYGFFFDSPRFAHGSVGQHERRIVGFPVLESIDVYYEMSAAKPLSIDVPPGWVPFAEKTLDGFGLQYTCRRVEEPDGRLRKCVFCVPPVIPARVSFRVDHQAGSCHRGVDKRRSPRARRARVSEPRNRRKRSRGPGAAHARTRFGVPQARAAGGGTSMRPRAGLLIVALGFVLGGCATHALMPTPALYTRANAMPLFADSPVDRQESALDLLYVTDRAPAQHAGDLPYTSRRSRSVGVRIGDGRVRQGPELERAARGKHRAATIQPAAPDAWIDDGARRAFLPFRTKSSSDPTE